MTRPPLCWNTHFSASVETHSRRRICMWKKLFQILHVKLIWHPDSRKNHLSSCVSVVTVRNRCRKSSQPESQQWCHILPKTNTLPAVSFFWTWLSWPGVQMPESGQSLQRYPKSRFFACVLGITVAKVFWCVLQQNSVFRRCCSQASCGDDAAACCWWRGHWLTNGSMLCPVFL